MHATRGAERDVVDEVEHLYMEGARCMHLVHEHATRGAERDVVDEVGHRQQRVAAADGRRQLERARLEHLYMEGARCMH